MIKADKRCANNIPTDKFVWNDLKFVDYKYKIKIKKVKSTH